MKPQRIQLSRCKGFNLQAYSRALNGLPAKKVDRTTPWGNRFGYELRGKPWAVKRHRRWLSFKAQAKLRQRIRAELAGYNLACWCKPWECCHGDNLLVVLLTTD